MHKSILKIIIRNIRIKYNDLTDEDREKIISEYKKFNLEQKKSKVLMKISNDIDIQLFQQIEHEIGKDNYKEGTIKIIKIIKKEIMGHDINIRCNLLKNIIKDLNQISIIINENIQSIKMKSYGAKIIKKIIEIFEKKIISENCTNVKLLPLDVNLQNNITDCKCGK